jgi:glucan phosphorylase
MEFLIGRTLSSAIENLRVENFVRSGFSSDATRKWLAQAKKEPDACLGNGGLGRITVVPNVPSVLRGIPYDRPMIGYGGHTINTLRLWGAAAHENSNFVKFSRGEFFDAVHEKLVAEALTRVL